MMHFERYQHKVCASYRGEAGAVGVFSDLIASKPDTGASIFSRLDTLNRKGSIPMST
jgi:hypothetical protein